MPERILWFCPKPLTSKMNYRLQQAQNRAGLQTNGIFYVSLATKIRTIWQKSGKVKEVVSPNAKRLIVEHVNAYIDKLRPKVIVINDQAVLNTLLNNEWKLEKCRGSVYHYRDIPCIVIDDLLKAFSEKADLRGKSKVDAGKYRAKYNSWILRNDLEKTKRWVNGTQNEQPKFTYTVCRTRSDLEKLSERVGQASLVAPDIETYGPCITCIGYTLLFPSGEVHSYVIPFMDGRNASGCFWNTSEDYQFAYETMRTVNASPVPKVLQGGHYDAAYLIYYRAPLRNWYADTFFAMYALWVEAPRSIAFTASLFLDYYMFWKEESKGDAEEKKKEKFHRTTEELERYWRYCCLDTYNTLLCWLRVSPLLFIEKNKWALENYKKVFRAQVGPALLMSMTGLRESPQRLAKYVAYETEQTEKNLKSLRIMTREPEFNPNSTAHKSWLIYDLLGAKPIKLRGKNASKNPRTTDEKILKLIAATHPFFDIFIQKIWDTNKPKNKIAKYSRMRLLNNRVMFNAKAGATVTTRYATSQHAMGYGTNVQNWDPQTQPIVVADDGWVFFEPDYSKSDTWFVAFTSQDEEMMRVVSGERDTHCHHVEMFFKIPYDKVYKGYKAKEDWVIDAVRGVRQNSKRIGHGANYQMGDYTLYVLMGHNETIAAAETTGAKILIIKTRMGKERTVLWIPFLGSKEHEIKDGTLIRELSPGEWKREYLIFFCGVMLEQYYKGYRGMNPWFRSSIEECVANGNKVTTAYGFTRYFFGDVAHDKAIQRQISAQYGQGGTSGNINRCLDEFYYSGKFDFNEIMLLSQTHDSLFFQIREEKLHHWAPKVIELMEQPVTINERTFSVPAEGKVGYSWGDRFMLEYSQELTLNEVRSHDKKMAEKWCRLKEEERKVA